VNILIGYVFVCRFEREGVWSRLESGLSLAETSVTVYVSY